MNEHLFASIILKKVDEFIDELPGHVIGKIMDDIGAVLEGDYFNIHVKTISGKIKELIVGDYRVVFFLNSNTIYFIHIFLKKTRKTPKKEIEYAEKIYKQIINYEKN